MHARRAVAAVALAAALMAPVRPAPAQDATSGALEGVVRELGTEDPLAGVLVVASSGGREQTAMTDERGRYRITGLVPGAYQVLFHYAEITTRYQGVPISINHTSALHPKLDLSKGGVTYEFDGRAPVLDPTESRIGHIIGREQLDKGIFPGTDVVDALGVIPGTSSDAAGIAFSGSTSPESRINIDGLDTTGVKYGTLGGSLLAEFVEEVDVATGGYNAEHGRSTGAVISVVTKTGSNELQGSVFGRITPGLLVAPQKESPSESSSIDVESNLAYRTDFGVELGGPIVRDRLWYYVGFAPRLARTDVTRITKRRTDCRMPLAGGELSECDPTAHRDGVPDEDPATGFLIYEEVDRERIAASQTRYPLLAKLNWAPRREHQGQLSLIATPVSGETVGVRGAPAATRRDFSQLTTDLAAKWTSKLHDGRTELSAVVGWHRVATHADSIDDAFNDVPLEVHSTGNLGDLAALGHESDATRRGCADGPDDPYPLIENCPVDGLGYAVGGPGSITDETAERFALRLDATRRLKKAAGDHAIKAGIDLEDNRLDHLRKLSGGVWYDIFGTSVNASRWIQVAPPGAEDAFPDVCLDGGVDGTQRSCRLLDQQRVSGRTINWAAYLRDSWQPYPNLTLNAGLRYEEQRLRYADELQKTVDPFTGDERGKNAIVLRGMWSPRLGAAYDWTKEGKSRAFAHWGRFYESIPMDINDRMFGGETLYRATYDAGVCGGADCAGEDPSRGVVFGGGVLVAPGLKAQYMDEYVVGLEYELTDELKIGASYQNRRLGRVLEDVSVDNAETYILANPGEWSAEDERAFQERIDATTDPAERARLEDQLGQLRRIRTFDRPRRDYQAVTLTATRRFSREMFLQASYTYARNQGNYPGLLSSDNGQLDPNISSQYDLIELLANRDGPLPNDRPHYIKVDAYYTFDLSKWDALTAGVRGRALSGTPISALARHPLYGFNESFLLPRGAVGRSDFELGLDTRVAYARKLSGGMELEAYLDIFGLLNRQGVAAVSQAYTLDSANPVVGGDYEDLVFAKRLTDTGAETPDPISRYGNFANPTSRYAPLSARLGARLLF